MKEKEAKTKWCPMFRQTSDEGFWRTNRQGDCNVNCIASDCMMWVWDTEYTSEEVEKGIWASGQKQSETEGHCGLINS